MRLIAVTAPTTMSKSWLSHSLKPNELTTTRPRRTKNSKVEIDGLGWDALPTLPHVVSRLARCRLMRALMRRSRRERGVADVFSAQRIEQS